MIPKPIRLTPLRRFVCDFLEAAHGVPTVPTQRRMKLGNLRAAREAHPARPPWTALFTKAYSLTALEVPELRRAYVKIPWGHLVEYEGSVASFAVEREYRGERGIFFGRIRKPERRTLTDITNIIRELQNGPIEENPDFRRTLWMCSLPGPLRRLAWWVGLNYGRQRSNYVGTFGVSVYSALGAESLHPIAPVNTLNYGVISPDGEVDVRLTYDHRVMDGATVARALARLEVVLNTTILDELHRDAAAAHAA
jgi:hypothetical protein